MLDLRNKVTILDGAMGTMLQKRGLLSAHVPEAVNLNNAYDVIDIHRQYLRAGADIIYTNTFSCNRYKLSGSGYTVAELAAAAIANAKTAVSLEKPQAKVALSCGPIGEMLRPNGTLSFDDAYDIFREIVQSAVDGGVDLIIFETFTDLLEMKAAVLAAKENSDLPIFTTMSFEENGRTFTGTSVAAAAVTLSALGVDAVGINCSLGPAQILPLAQEMRKWTDLPIIVKANAGLPNLTTGEYDISAADFAALMPQYVKSGVSILGGCCGTTPEYIAAISANVASLTPYEVHNERRLVLCGGENVVVVDGVRVVGERINPTGKKAMKEALKNHDMSYLLNQALEQTSAGAEILDVNVGLPEIDELSMMTEAIEALQGVTAAPLQIDSSDAAVIEAALRRYNGKALVNSVNGEQKVLDTILPIVKKYGAAVVGLTLDENGIPDKAEERVAIAERIIKTAEKYGIAREDVVIDCLTLTVSVQQEQAKETLKALREVKERFGVKTTLGVSNISFGLPEREVINTSFLTHAMIAGLDLPIINPNNRSMMGAVDAFGVLNCSDLGSVQYIERHSNAAPAVVTAANDITLDYAVENGLQQAASAATQKQLAVMSANDIIEQVLIPALDRVGEKFETGKLFLPQLIQSATAAQAAFEVIKNHLAKDKNTDTVSRGRIILATVKGDIHDIGKNIVKVILENYGYDIIDLGRDVPKEKVVEAALQHDVKLVGLSALMTTTVKSMEETIAALKAAGDIKVMVGGAVLTRDYAAEIGADFYAKDAKESADIAKKFFGK